MFYLMFQQSDTNNNSPIIWLEIDRTPINEFQTKGYSMLRAFPTFSYEEKFITEKIILFWMQFYSEF
jgi:hypothetical protein